MLTYQKVYFLVIDLSLWTVRYFNTLLSKNQGYPIVFFGKFNRKIFLPKSTLFGNFKENYYTTNPKDMV